MGGFDNLAYLTRLFVCLFGLFRLPHLTFSPRPVALIIGKLCIADSHRGGSRQHLRSILRYFFSRPPPQVRKSATGSKELTRPELRYGRARQPRRNFSTA